ncbi:Uncharacterized protein FWK35_00005751 [Aphis craccivora]|uniref:Uncharacterized protein n=1 Tax=Aphis craccivora TaxID=307492 RepID=A0A6G0YQK1_APHCR|nr:Uncharacterized protein FWK35_00005751 [Aphis craccivora]
MEGRRTSDEKNSRTSRTRRMDVVAQDIKDIKDNSVFDDVYDREKWRGYVMEVMALNGLTS